VCARAGARAVTWPAGENTFADTVEAIPREPRNDLGGGERELVSVRGLRPAKCVSRARWRTREAT